MSPTNDNVKLFDLQELTRAFQPAVLEASRALQFAADVAENSQMIGEVSVKLWKMPVPKMTDEKILADRVLQITYPLWTPELRNTVLAENEGSGDMDGVVYQDGEDDDGGEDADDDNETIEDDEAIPNSDADSEGSDVDDDGKETDSEEEMDEADRPSTPSPVCPNTNNDDDQFDYDSENDITFEGDDDSDDESDQSPPFGPEANAARNEAWSSLLDTRRQESRAAVVWPEQTVVISPPRFHQTPPHIAAKGDRNSPFYWKTGLTGMVVDWLANPKTTGWQMHLSAVDLTGVDLEYSLAVDVRQGATIKLTRMNIDPASEMVGGQGTELDWLLVHLTYEDGAPNGLNPYWVLAVPVRAISDAKSAQVDGGEIVVTACTIGWPGMAPMVHGHGVQRRSFKKFVKACAKGTGMIVMESSEAVVL